MQPLLVAVLVFILFAVVLAGVAYATRGSKATERLRKLTQPTGPERTPLSSAKTKQKRDLLPTLSAIINGRGLAEKLFVELTSAGLPVRPSEYLGIVAAGVIASQVLALVVAKNALGNVLFGAIAIAIPVGVLRSLQGKRRQTFNAQIMDALTMIASSLRSGFSFLRAIQTVANEMPPPIAQEFQRVVDEVNVGRSTEDALKSVVTRVKSYDFDLVVSAVLIQLQVGGNLADILDNISETLRERVRIIGEMRAMTAEGKISGIILMLLPFFLALLLMSISPGYISTLFNEPLGRIMIGVAIALQVIGGLIIKRMLVLDT
jgi:tight adherence protein B